MTENGPEVTVETHHGETEHNARELAAAAGGVDPLASIHGEEVDDEAEAIVDRMLRDREGSNSGDVEPGETKVVGIVTQSERPTGTAAFPTTEEEIAQLATEVRERPYVELPKEGEVRLNIGGGETGVEGEIVVDRSGEIPMEAWPLPYEDGSVDAIYSSHTLEHFPHRLVPTVLAEWWRVLKPGGKIQISVPDFTKISKLIAAGQPCRAPDGRIVNWAAVVGGGQTDLNDYHLSHMDYADLATLLSRMGAIGVREFRPYRLDCSQYQISANIEARKPSAKMMERAMNNRVAGCRTVPRLGWTRTAERMAETSLKSGVDFTSAGGAYADLGFERAIQKALDSGDHDFILVTDYDTVWERDTPKLLVMLMDEHPEIDAIFPIQLRRGTQEILASADERHSLDSFAAEVVEVRSGHLGCTLFRRSVFEEILDEEGKGRPPIERPWFRHVDSVDENGNAKLTEADMAFWKKLRDAGFTVAVAPHVAVGHAEEFIVWPDQNLQPIHQPDVAYDEDGPPPNVRL